MDDYRFDHIIFITVTMHIPTYNAWAWQVQIKASKSFLAYFKFGVIAQASLFSEAAACVAFAGT